MIVELPTDYAPAQYLKEPTQRRQTALKLPEDVQDRLAVKKRLQKNLIDSKDILHAKEQERQGGVESLSKFVGYFYSFMIQKMRESVPEGPFSAGRSEKVFQQQLDMEMGERLGSNPVRGSKGTHQDSNLNPLTRSMVKSYMGRLDTFIERTQEHIAKLEHTLSNEAFQNLEMIEQLKAPINSGERDLTKEMNDLSSETKRRYEEMQVEMAKIKPVETKVTEGVNREKIKITPGHHQNSQRQMER